MAKATTELKKYNEIIENTEFIRLTKEVVNSFMNNASVWYIPNFDSLNKSNDLLPHIQRCFISKILIKDITKNYEYYEAIGDKFWSSAMTSYIVFKFPEIITPNKITLAFAKYMSTQYQAELSRMFIPNYEKILNISYPDYETTSSDIKDKIAEDIFESFCGAIYLWAEKILPCSGILYISNILRKMLETKGDITKETMESLTTDNISKLYNLLRLLYTLNSIDYNERYTDGRTPTIDLTVRFKDPSGEVKIFKSTSSAKTVKTAKDIVSGEMIKQLESNGYSENVINKIYNQRIQYEKEVIEKIKSILNDKKVPIIKRKKEKQVVREDDDVIYTTIDPKSKTIKVSYNIKDKEGSKEILYVGSDMSRFDALRFLLDKTKNQFE